MPVLREANVLRSTETVLNLPIRREKLFLEVVDNIPPSLAHNSEVLMNGYRDYQEMVLARGGLRSIYLITLTLVLLMSMFAAIALSVIIATRITKTSDDFA